MRTVCIILKEIPDQLSIEITLRGSGCYLEIIFLTAILLLNFLESFCQNSSPWKPFPSNASNLRSAAFSGISSWIQLREKYYENWVHYYYQNPQESNKKQALILSGTQILSMQYNWDWPTKNFCYWSFGSACVAVPVTDGIIFFWSIRQGSLGSFSLCLTTSPEVIFDRLESRIPPLLPGNTITGQTILFMVVFQKGAMGIHLIHSVAKILEFFALLEFSPWTDSALWV